MLEEIKKGILECFNQNDDPLEHSALGHGTNSFGNIKNFGIEIWCKKEFNPLVSFKADISYQITNMISREISEEELKEIDVPITGDWCTERLKVVENIDLILEKISNSIKDKEVSYVMITKKSLGGPDKRTYPDYIPEKKRLRIFPNIHIPNQYIENTKFIYTKIDEKTPEALYSISGALKKKDIAYTLILNGSHKKNLQTLTELPKTIQKLTLLEKLEIKNIKIKSIPDWIGELKNLRSLTIIAPDTTNTEEERYIQEIPESIFELTQLQFLTIHNTNIKEIPENIGKLNKLVELDISYNQLINIPQSIERLENLEKLKIVSSIPDERTEYYYNEKPLRKHWVQIDSVNEGLSEDEYLEKYNVDIRTNNDIYAGLTTIPKSISKLKKLTHLNLSGNKELQLSDEIGEIMELRELQLNEMDLKEIPEKIQNNIKLDHLSIENNPNIKEIPIWIDKLQDLRWISTLGCRFSVIPNTLNKLDMPKLDNGQEIFSDINLPELPSLFLKQKREVIKKWSESLTKLPDWIGMLSNNIYNIDIRRYNSKIKFTELPDSFGELINLQVISLDHHQISNLPSSMKNLTNVTEIYLNDNKLTALPDWIRHMTKLKVLTFASNEIEEVPDWIGELKNLQRLIYKD